MNSPVKHTAGRLTALQTYNMTALTDEQKALVYAFMKEDDDKTWAIVKDMFNIKFIELDAVTGDNNVAFSGDVYDADDEYVINIFEALDADDIEVKGELTISDATKTVNGFVLNAVNACSVKIITYRKTPKINFWT